MVTNLLMINLSLTRQRLYLYFSGRNCQNRAPIRKTTASFFSRRNVSFFSGRNENFPPQQKNCQFPANRRLYLFFPVVIKISRHYKKNANFPPEPKTNTTAQPTRQTTVSFFSGAHPPDRRLYLFFSGPNENFLPQQKNCQFPARTKN